MVILENLIVMFHLYLIHFRRETALSGLIGAILGVPKAEVPLKFDEKNLRVAVEIEKPIKTFTHVTNLRQDSAGGIDYSIKHSKKN